MTGHWKVAGTASSMRVKMLLLLQIPSRYVKYTFITYSIRIPNLGTECDMASFQPGQCGTTLPYHLHNLKEMGLPKTNETLEMTICGTAVGEKGYFQCVEQQKIKVKKCEDFFVYYLGPLKFVAYKEAAAICIQSM